MAIAGFLSSDKRWEKFQQRWKSVLGEAGIEFFHMSDFESRYGPYADWSEEKRISIFRELIGAIKKRTVAGISVATILADYEAVKPVFHPKLKSPYAFCAFKAMLHVEKWADDYKHYEPIAYIFEQGAGFNGELDIIRRYIESSEELKKRLRYSGMTIMDKRKLNPLQAADILAYETWKEMCNYIVPEKEERGLRKSMIEIMRGCINYNTYYDKENLHKASKPAVSTVPI